jgi:hypothetical protein
MGAPLTVCGKPLSPEDRKLWQQAICALVGVKVRTGFGSFGLATALAEALERAAGKRHICEDCGVKVARGRILAEGEGGGSGPLGDRYLVPPHTLHRISCKPLRN